LDLHLVGQVDVEQQLLAPTRRHAAVAEQVDEVARMLLAGHEQHLAHADALQQLERVVDHRPAPDRKQVLVRDASQLLESRRGTAGADEALHCRAGWYSCAAAGAVSARRRGPPLSETTRAA